MLLSKAEVTVMTPLRLSPSEEVKVLPSNVPSFSLDIDHSRSPTL